jgi:hypothetical protein
MGDDLIIKKLGFSLRLLHQLSAMQDLRCSMVLITSQFFLTILLSFRSTVDQLTLFVLKFLQTINTAKLFRSLMISYSLAPEWSQQKKTI